MEVINEVLANFTICGMSHKKSIADTVSRTRERYKIYLQNGYGRAYLLECLITEMGKYILG